MLKKLILILMPLALLMEQQMPGQTKKTAKKKPAAAAQQSDVAQPVAAAAATPATPPASSNAVAPTIPAGAKELEPFLFAFTDAQGKKWLYRQTPFGVVKWEDKPVAPPLADNTNPVIITDLGDSVRFLWKTPFGDQTWVRKKSELTDDEKTMIQHEANKRPAPDPLAAPKQTGLGQRPPEKQ